MHLLLSLMLLVGGFTPAPAATPAPTGSTIIYVQESLDGKWDPELRAAVAYVDRYTHRTRMVLGSCHVGHRCIRVSYGDARGAAVGSASASASSVVVRRSWAGYGYHPHVREQLAIHELGHVFGLGHNASTRSVMYPDLYLGSRSRMSGATFTAAEQRALANR